MSEPWFDANLWGWLPGTAVGVAGGVWGSLVGIFAPRGRGKALIWASYWLLLATGIVLTSVSVYAIACGQPYGVWYALLLPGVLIVLVLGPLGFVGRKAYRQAEERRIRSEDI